MTNHKKQHLPPTNPRAKPPEPNAPPSSSSARSHMTRKNDSKRSSTAPVQQKLLFSTIPTPNSDPNPVTVAAVTPGNNLAPPFPEPLAKIPAQTQESPSTITTETSSPPPTNVRTSLRYRVILDVKPDKTSNKTLPEVFSDNVKTILG